ncbi:MAG TPA: hypothetical protein VE263_14390 [Candidatus Angelobacter sp.]|nr:hypothetical protein [Candidatus Angelobacter sp.]
MTTELLQKDFVKKAAEPDIRMRLRASDALNGLYATNASFKQQTGNVSAMVVTGGNVCSHFGADVVSAGQAEAFNSIYSELNKHWRWSGSTVAILRDNYSLCAPSSYAVTPVEYIEYLQTTKQNLESRVSELEMRLNDIQIYWPTMKKLITDYQSATARVEGFVKDLTTKYGSRSALEMAKRRDVLEKPAVDFLAELE